MTENEIGYLIYKWEQAGYHFIPLPYDPEKDYTKYLSYYANQDDNERLRQHVIDKAFREEL